MNTISSSFVKGAVILSTSISHWLLFYAAGFDTVCAST